MTFLVLVPAFVVLAVYVLAFSLCRAASRGDEVAREALRNRGGGWMGGER